MTPLQEVCERFSPCGHSEVGHGGARALNVPKSVRVVVVGNTFLVVFCSFLCVLLVLAAGSVGPVFLQHLCLRGVVLVGMVVFHPRGNWMILEVFCNLILFLHVKICL